jgi:hypothetical protein
MQPKKIPFLKTMPYKKGLDLSKLKYRFYRNYRNYVIKLRFTQAEYERLSSNVQMPLAVYCREKALDNMIVRRIPPPKVDPKLLRQLVGIGNNLNQITKLANQKNNANNFDVLSLLGDIAEIRQAMTELVKHYTAQKDNSDAS